MRVRATAPFTAIRECQLITVGEGDEIAGDVAAYLLRTGAAVIQIDGEDQEQIADEDQEPADELDITKAMEKVLEWVGEDQERALEASVAESEKDKPRPRLLARLNEIMT